MRSQKLAQPENLGTDPTLRCIGGIEPTGLKLSHKSIKRGAVPEMNSGWQDKDPKTCYVEVGHVIFMPKEEG